MKIPNFDIDTSGLTDSVDALQRQFSEASARLSRGAAATERNLETERSLRRGAALRGFGGRLLLGGVAIGSSLSRARNQKAVNHRVNQAQIEYERAMLRFEKMTSAQQAEFLNSGELERINDSLLDFLDDDIYGLDTDNIKQRWSAQFRGNYNKLQLQVYKTLKKENKQTIGRNRATFRNKIIANPYHPDATNGVYATEFRNSINGLVDTIEEADEYQLYDQIYGMLNGLYNHGDHENMEKILKTDQAKSMLGDDYNKMIKLKNSLKETNEREGNTAKVNVTNLGGSFSRLSENMDVASFQATMDYEGFSDLGRGYIKAVKDYVINADPRKAEKIDLSQLHRLIPNTANPTQQAKIHNHIRQATAKIQEAFTKDPVDVYLRANSEDGSPYLPPQERGLIFENTGRILTNNEVNTNANVLVAAFNEGFDTFKEVQDNMTENLGANAMIEVHAMLPDAIKGSDAQKKNYVKVIQLASLPEVSKILPLPEAREAIANGIGIPSSNNMRGLGNAVDKSWSNNKDLMDVISILAHARTRRDPSVRKGEGLETGDFALKYWENFNAIVEDYDESFTNVTDIVGPTNRFLGGFNIGGVGIGPVPKGLGGTHLQHRTAAGKAIDPDGYAETIKTFEDNMNTDYFKRYGSDIFSQETMELLDREDTMIEATLIDGNYEFYMTVPRGDQPPLSYPAEKVNGQQFKLPVQIMYRSKGKIFQNTPYFQEGAFSPPQVTASTELPRPTGPDTIGPPEIANTPIGKKLGKHGIVSKLDYSISRADTPIPGNVLQPLMLKLMFRESRFDPKVTENGNIKGRPRGKGILQLTSPHLTKGIDPTDTQQAIDVGVREIDRLFKQGVGLAMAENRRRVSEGQAPLDFTNSDIMIYAIKAWNGGGVDSPRGFNTETIIRANEGRLSTPTPANNFAYSILYGLADLSPEEEAEVNMKEQEEFFGVFSKDSRVKRWMEAPITQAQRGE